MDGISAPHAKPGGKRHQNPPSVCVWAIGQSATNIADRKEKRGYGFKW